MPDSTDHGSELLDRALAALHGFMTRNLSEAMVNTALGRPLGEVSNSGTFEGPSADADNFSDYLRVLFGPLPANPSKRETIERLTATFASDAYAPASEVSDQSSFEASLEEALSGHEAVAVIGNRGSGKTIWINNWLNRRTKTFFEETLRSNWFRIDVTKLYKIATQKDLRLGRMGMLEYFQAHSAYVYLEYSGELHNPNSSPPDTESPLLRVVADSIRTGDDATLQQYRRDLATVADYYIDLQRRTTTRERSSRFPSETAIAELCQDYNRAVREAFIRIFQAFAKACAAENVGVVAIIDGVDNVSWSLRDNVYLRMCEDTAEFIRDFEVICPEVERGILLVARPETVPQLRAKSHTDGNDIFADLYSKFRELRLPVANYEKVLRRKLSAASDGPEFEAERSACVSRLSLRGARDGTTVFRDYIGRYESNTTSFFEQLRVEIEGLISDVPVAPASVFTKSAFANAPMSSVMFDDNLRAMLNGFRRSLSGRARAVDLAVASVEAIKMVEYLLLGGKLYVDSMPAVPGSNRFSDIAPGEVFPNIFWYDMADAGGSESRWHGLAGLRLLQAAYASPMAAGELLAILHVGFDYPLPLLLEHLEAFVAFGLLEIDPSRRPKELNGQTGELGIGDYRSTVRTSAKGRLVATLSMFWADWQYFLALDTPMHRYFLPEASGQQFTRFYRSPRSPTQVNFHYADALVPTVATFLRHVRHYSREEITRLKLPGVAGKLAVACGNSANVQNLILAFAIPDGWLNLCERQLTRRLRGRRRGHPGGKAGGDEGALLAHLAGVFAQDMFR